MGLTNNVAAILNKCGQQAIRNYVFSYPATPPIRNLTEFGVFAETAAGAGDLGTGAEVTGADFDAILGCISIKKIENQ